MIISLIILGLFVLILVILLLVSQMKIKSYKAILLVRNQEISLIQQKVYEKEIELVQVRSDLSHASRQLIEQASSIELQKRELDEKLKGIGQEFVFKGLHSLKDENAKNLLEVLKPFKDKLDRFESEVRQNETNNVERFSKLSTVIKMLDERHDQIRTTAQSLVDALRGENKIQGNWGEMALKRILEVSGLTEGQEYFTQATYRDDQNLMARPDVIIQLPGNKQLIIDSKVSLIAFDKYVNEEDSMLKKMALRDHIDSLKNHIKLLSSKDYKNLPGIDTLEFVMMFIPLESSVALAVKEEPGLYEIALRKNIVLVTPSTLLATLKTIESTWIYERQNKNTLAIADEAGKMYDKFVDFVGDMEKIGRKQFESQMAFEVAMNKLTTGSGNLVRRAEKMKKMGAKASKQLDSKHLELDENNDEI